MKLLIRPSTSSGRITDEATPQEVPRQSPDYKVSIADLIAFARCAFRWAHGHDEPNTKGYKLGDVVRALCLAGQTARTVYVRRPDTYEHRELMCPTCHKEGPGRKCTRCNRTRLEQTRAKPWAAAARECVEWTARAEHSRRVVVTPGDWDKATSCSAAVWADPDCTALLESAARGLWAEVTYSDPATRQKIIVRDRIDILPHEGSPLDCAVGMLWPVVDAAHGVASLHAQVGYRHMHAAFMRTLANLCGETDRREVLCIMVEINDPHVVARRRFAAELVNSGQELLLETLAALAQCRARAEWPTFDASSPGHLHGWSVIQRDPQIQEGNEKADARFAIQAAKILAGAAAPAQLGAPERAGVGAV